MIWQLYSTYTEARGLNIPLTTEPRGVNIPLPVAWVTPTPFILHAVDSQPCLHTVRARCVWRGQRGKVTLADIHSVYQIPRGLRQYWYVCYGGGAVGTAGLVEEEYQRHVEVAVSCQAPEGGEVPR